MYIMYGVLFMIYDVLYCIWHVLYRILDVSRIVYAKKCTLKWSLQNDWTSKWTSQKLSECLRKHSKKTFQKMSRCRSWRPRNSLDVWVDVSKNAWMPAWTFIHCENKCLTMCKTSTQSIRGNIEMYAQTYVQTMSCLFGCLLKQWDVFLDVSKNNKTTLRNMETTPEKCHASPLCIPHQLQNPTTLDCHVSWLDRWKNFICGCPRLRVAHLATTWRPPSTPLTNVFWISCWILPDVRQNFGCLLHVFPNTNF